MYTWESDFRAIAACRLCIEVCVCMFMDWIVWPTSVVVVMVVMVVEYRLFATSTRLTNMDVLVLTLKEIASISAARLKANY